MRAFESSRIHIAMASWRVAMSTISNYPADFNLFGKWECKRDESPTCPHCQSPMKYRDRRPRHFRKEGGVKYWGVVRRYYCKECKRLHTELPANVSPYKHYEVDVIEGVVDGVVTQDDLESEDYPCAKTMERWKAWIEHNRTFIEGHIRSVGFQILSLGISFLKTQENILDTLRIVCSVREIHWLTIVNRIVYNTGTSLDPWPLHAP